VGRGGAGACTLSSSSCRVLSRCARRSASFSPIRARTCGARRKAPEERAEYCHKKLFVDRTCRLSSRILSSCSRNLAEVACKVLAACRFKLSTSCSNLVIVRSFARRIACSISAPFEGGLRETGDRLFSLEVCEWFRSFSPLKSVLSIAATPKIASGPVDIGLVRLTARKGDDGVVPIGSLFHESDAPFRPGKSTSFIDFEVVGRIFKGDDTRVRPVA
jgi:hypothetical protein